MRHINSENEPEIFIFYYYELTYPNSKIEITVSTDEKINVIDVFDILWTGRNGETKYNVSY